MLLLQDVDVVDDDDSVVVDIVVGHQSRQVESHLIKGGAWFVCVSGVCVWGAGR
jgi:hypothetical protein